MLDITLNDCDVRLRLLDDVLYISKHNVYYTVARDEIPTLLDAWETRKEVVLKDGTRVGTNSVTYWLTSQYKPALSVGIYGHGTIHALLTVLLEVKR